MVISYLTSSLSFVAEAINTLAQQENLFKIEVEAAQRPRDAVEDLLRQMVAQLGGINTRLRTFEGSVNRMEATVAGQGERLDNIDERLDSIDGHLTNLLVPSTFPARLYQHV
ncbi:Uncharacterized protein HZ326_19025 [Fusarium oxysporum f. sp. albedinis]|nr:Uncharacterized protein HZ326_19025 [Fusarium oxysporum f. sp. albedinis]